MDAEVGGQWPDSSGNGRHATVLGGVALVFDADAGVVVGEFKETGRGDPEKFLAVSNSDGAFDFGTGDFSIAAWTKLDAIEPTDERADVILAGEGLNSFNYGKHKAMEPFPGEVDITVAPEVSNAAHRMYFLNAPGAAATRGLNYKTDTDWHHVAIVREGIQLTFYHDGVEQTTYTVDASLEVNANTSIVRIGNYFEPGQPSDSGGPFEGRMRFLCVWRRALTPAEIIALRDGS